MKLLSEVLHWIPAFAGMTQVRASLEDAFSPYVNRRIPELRGIKDETVEQAARI